MFVSSVKKSDSLVHIPVCRTRKCRDFMTTLLNTMQSSGVQCVVEGQEGYSKGGLYRDTFSHFAQVCHITIIHICPEILIKMSKVLDILKEYCGKIWFVHIPCSPENYPETFLHEFNIRDLLSDTEVQKFVLEVAAETRSLTSRRPVQEEDGGIKRMESDENAYEEFSVLERFIHLSLVHRGKDQDKLCIMKSFLKESAEKLKWETINDCQMLSEGFFPTNNDTSILSLIHHVVLPNIYSQRKIIHLAHFVICKEPSVSSKANDFMKMLLFQPNSFPSSDLKAVEEIYWNLYDSEDSMEISLESRNWEALVISYLQVLALFIVKYCRLERSVHLTSITKRPLFKKLKPSLLLMPLKVKDSSDRKSYLKALVSCVLEWEHMSKEEMEQITTSVTPSSKSFTDRLEIKLLAVLIHLMQLHQNSESSPLFHNMNCKIRVQKKNNTMKKTLSRMIHFIIIDGFTAHLIQQAKESTSPNAFTDLCVKINEGLGDVMKQLHNDDKVSCFEKLTPLLFHKNKTVRQHVSFLCNSNGMYKDRVLSLLLLETKYILVPFLNFDGKLDDSNNGTDSKNKLSVHCAHVSWNILSGSFVGHKCLIHIHHPTVPDHMRLNGLPKTSQEFDRYFNELNILKCLDHSSVVQLLSYHIDCCPQFYITEDYLSKPVQPMLVSKSKNNNHFTTVRLLQLLTEALEGIQFCHENRIIHRDLTSANLYFTNTGTVKLSGFKQACKLARNLHYVREFDCSFIATRWSAPESLCHCRFSVASDMWMVGHLLYEVLTHGRLPYADIANQHDEYLMTLVVKGQRTLCQDPCISTTMFLLIQQLTYLEETMRMNIQDVAAGLRTEMEKETARNNCSFPDISHSGQAATEHNKGLVLQLLDVYSDLQSLGDEQENSDGYINSKPQKGSVKFREKCPPDFSTKEWTVLMEEKLPGVTELIGRPVQNQQGQKELPFAITASSLWSLKEAVLNRWLGADIKPYIFCLQQIARILTTLHSKGLILRDFAADSIYLEKVNNSVTDIKIWLTSLTWIKILPVTADNSTGNNMGQFVTLEDYTKGIEHHRRAAPEVIRSGQYSMASDVYCFSVLVWWLFNAFDVSSDSQKPPPESLAPLSKIPVGEEYENILLAYHEPLLNKPLSCPLHIYQRIKECWQPQRHDRPYMAVLQAYMTADEPSTTSAIEIMRECELFIDVANASEKSSISFPMQGQSANYADEYVDSEAESIYEDLSFKEGSHQRSDDKQLQDRQSPLQPPPLPVRPPFLKLLSASKSLTDQAHDEEHSRHALPPRSQQNINNLTQQNSQKTMNAALQRPKLPQTNRRPPPPIPVTEQDQSSLDPPSRPPPPVRRIHSANCPHQMPESDGEQVRKSNK